MTTIPEDWQSATTVDSIDLNGEDSQSYLQSAATTADLTDLICANSLSYLQTMIKM